MTIIISEPESYYYLIAMPKDKKKNHAIVGFYLPITKTIYAIVHNDHQGRAF